jgi:hypothetical protein
MTTLTRALTLACLIVFATPASAEEFEATGAIHIKTNVQYAAAIKDGQPWEETEYRNGGKTLVVAEIPFGNLPISFTIVARDNPEFGPITVSAERKNFKKKRSGRTFTWVYKTQVRFKRTGKKTVPGKKTEKAPKKPAKPKKEEADDL